MMNLKKLGQQAKQLGFTLIELSIVLVIIGLIVGGILVGQDLIKAAEIRATVSQLEKYSTAVNTFRSKYNGLPGDILNATNFGLQVPASTGASVGTSGFGDGNSIIQGGATTSDTFVGETACFWTHLFQANMINETSTYACGTITAAGLLTLAQTIPQTKLGRNNYVIVGSNGGINFFALGGLTASVSAAGLYYGTADSVLSRLMTTSEALQIDSKLDDSLPGSGIVQSTSTAIADVWGATRPVATTATGSCMSNATGSPYNFASANAGNDQACILRIRASF